VFFPTYAMASWAIASFLRSTEFDISALGISCMKDTWSKKKTSCSHGGEHEDNRFLLFFFCSPIQVDWRFRSLYCLHQGDLKRRCTGTRLHGAISQKYVTLKGNIWFIELLIKKKGSAGQWSWPYARHHSEFRLQGLRGNKEKIILYNCS
jgi:hypothetical protein